jgi:hypothetical protein
VPDDVYSKAVANMAVWLPFLEEEKTKLQTRMGKQRGNGGASVPAAEPGPEADWDAAGGPVPEEVRPVAAPAPEEVRPVAAPAPALGGEPGWDDEAFDEWAASESSSRGDLSEETAGAGGDEKEQPPPGDEGEREENYWLDAVGGATEKETPAAAPGSATDAGWLLNRWEAGR